MSAEDGVVNKDSNVIAPSSVSFKIIGLPESMNSIYQIIYSQRRVQMKPDVLRYKVQAKLLMPVWKCEDDWLYGIELEFHSDWNYKNGKIKRVDLSNLEKVVCDCVSEKYRFDDARIFEKLSWKVQNTEKSFVNVRLYQLLNLKQTISLAARF